MTHNHSHSGPRRPWQSPPALAGGLLVAVLLGMAVGVAVQQWRCGAPFNLAALGMSNPTLQQAEKAFRDGDDRTAARQFTRLAEANDPAAQYWLGHMTELGLGVPSNPTRAVELYKKAAGQNNVAAELRLGEIYLYGDLTPPDFALARSCLEKAAQHGNPRAAMLLGRMYRRGLGSGVDLQEAYAWSEVAMLEGSTFARHERDASLHSLNADDQKAAIARATNLFAQIKHGADSPQASSRPQASNTTAR